MTKIVFLNDTSKSMGLDFRFRRVPVCQRARESFEYFFTTQNNFNKLNYSVTGRTHTPLDFSNEKSGDKNEISLPPHAKYRPFPLNGLDDSASQ